MTNQADDQQIRTSSVSVQRSSMDKSVIHVSGELCGGATATMRRAVTKELNRWPGLLVLDMDGVIRIDADGVDAVVSAAMHAGESDISLCLVGVHGHPVGRALAEAELLELFEISTADSDA